MRVTRAEGTLRPAIGRESGREIDIRIVRNEMNQWIEANEANENEANEETEAKETNEKEVNEEKETGIETGIEVKETETETETEANEANGANEETEKEMKEAEAIDWSDRNMGNRRVVENVEMNRVEEIEADSREAIVAIGRRIDQDSVNSPYFFLLCLFVCSKTKRRQNGKLLNS